MELEELLEVQKRELEIREKTIREQLLEIAALHKKNTDLLKKVGNQEEELLQSKEEYEGQVSSFIAEIKRNEKYIEELKRIIAEKDSKFHAELEECLFKLEERSQKILEMEDSKSWKLTAPLRWILWKFKRKEA